MAYSFLQDPLGTPGRQAAAGEQVATSPAQQFPPAQQQPTTLASILASLLGGPQGFAQGYNPVPPQYGYTGGTVAMDPTGALETGAPAVSSQSYQGWMPFQRVNPATGQPEIGQAGGKWLETENAPNLQPFAPASTPAQLGPQQPMQPAPPRRPAPQAARKPAPAPARRPAPAAPSGIGQMLAARYPQLDQERPGGNQ